MTDFYTKNESDEFVLANPDDVLADRKRRWEKSESKRIRDEVTAAVRDELNRDIDAEVAEKAKELYQPQIDTANARVKELEIGLRRKTIAAEYGFKPDVEKYLGDGDEEAMRKEADTLKSNFISSATTAATKETQPVESKVQKETGLNIVV